MANSEHTSPAGVGVPIPRLGAVFTVLNIDDIYTGPTGTGQEWPNDNDLLIDYTANRMWRAADVDSTNWTYRKVAFNPAQFFNQTPMIGAVAPTLADTFKIYVDPTKYPYTLRVDSRQWFADPDLESIKIFRGHDVSAKGECISAYFIDGQLQGDAIPVEEIANDNPEGTGVWVRPVPGHCKIVPDQGEAATLVLYAANGEVAAVAYCNIYVTNVVMAAEKPTRMIQDIRLIGPFISPADDYTLLLPINLPIADLGLQAEVVYNDGIRVVPVDGTRMRLDGLTNSGAHDTYFVSSMLGETLDLLLCYQLASDESYVGPDLSDGVISRKYHATTDAVRGAYSVKLFVVPTWLDQSRGWRLEYWLMDLNRGTVYRATPYVQPAVNAPAFDPLLYGVKQRLSVTVDVSKVSNIYQTHTHVQSFGITLMSKGTDVRDHFQIEYNQGKPAYGSGIYAKYYYDNVTFWMLDIRAGYTNKAEWLKAMFDTIYCLYDHRTEDAPPEPTHMNIVTKSKSYVFPIDTWVNPFHIDFQVSEGETIQIKWIHRTGTDDLLLGISPMVCHQR